MVNLKQGGSKHATIQAHVLDGQKRDQATAHGRGSSIGTVLLAIRNLLRLKPLRRRKNLIIRLELQIVNSGAFLDRSAR